jgi:hypothetical protein
MTVSDVAGLMSAQHDLTFMMRLFAILVVWTGLRVGDERVSRSGSVCQARVEGLTSVKSEYVWYIARVFVVNFPSGGRKGRMQLLRNAYLG